jgi:flagellar biosynthesis GTPase FlhF
MMLIRTFRGQELGGVLAQVKEELGDDVEIISTRQVGKHEVEVSVSFSQTSLERKKVDTLTPTFQQESKQRLIDGELGNIRELREALNKQGLHPHFTQQLIQIASHTNLEKGRGTVDRLAGACLENFLRFDSSLPNSKRIVALVGPTGVGKTTTVAKLAANMRMVFNISVALISADTFRVGAADHLSNYANLLGIPCLAVDPQLPLSQGLYRGVRELGAIDLVLVDTSGFSPRDTDRVREMGRQLGQLEWCEKILLLPAPSNDVDLRASARAFSLLNCSRVIISKTDETGFMGPVANTVISLGRPLAFFNTGQRVPEDIEPACAARLGWMLTRTFH